MLAALPALPALAEALGGGFPGDFDVPDAESGGFPATFAAEAAVEPTLAEGGLGGADGSTPAPRVGEGALGLPASPEPLEAPGRPVVEG